MTGVFDPATHKIVAVDERGQHLHVQLVELALDMASLEASPINQRITNLEQSLQGIATGTSQETVAPSDELRAVAQRLSALEGKPSERVDLSGVYRTLETIAERVSALERRPVAAPPAPRTTDPGPAGHTVTLGPNHTITTHKHEDSGRLALAVAVASAAVLNGVQAGDYKWHGGTVDFSWNGLRFDAPGLIEFARKSLDQETTA